MTKKHLLDKAQELAGKGRYGDTMVVHMNPLEVQALSDMTPGGLTINPETGQPEAFLPFLLGMLGGAGAATLPATLAATAAPAAAAAALPAIAAPALAAPTLAATLPAATAATTAATTAAPAAMGLGALEATAPALAAAETAAVAAPQQMAAMGLGEMGGMQAAQQAGAIAAPAAPLPPPIDPATVPAIGNGGYPIPNSALKGDILQPSFMNTLPDPAAQIPQGVPTPKMPDQIGGIGGANPVGPMNLPSPPSLGLGPSPDLMAPGGDVTIGMAEELPYGAGPGDTGMAGPQDITPNYQPGIDETVYGAQPPTPPTEAADKSGFSLGSITSSPYFLPGALALGSLASSALEDGPKKKSKSEGPDAVAPEEGDYTASFPGSDYVPGTDAEHNYFPERRYKNGGIVDDFAAATMSPFAASLLGKDISTGLLGGAIGVAGRMLKDGDDKDKYADGGVVNIPFDFADASVAGSSGAPGMGMAAGSMTPGTTGQSFGLNNVIAPPAFAAGGPIPGVPPMSGPGMHQDPRVMIIKEAELALQGAHPDPQGTLMRFTEVFGEEALRQLAQKTGGGPGGRMIDGPGGPRSDDVPARIDETQEARLSNGEFVMTAEAVKNIGGGDPMVGAQMLTQMNEQMGGVQPTGQVNVTKVR